MFQSRDYTPTLAAIQALDGRIYATLTPDEINVVIYYVKTGRKYDVLVTCDDGDGHKLQVAPNDAEVQHFLKATNARISVFIGPEAESAWHVRHGFPEPSFHWKICA